jgi:hypothetical protein
MRHLATAIFPIFHLISVFRCFITHTSASELHRTFPFILLLHKIYYYAYPHAEAQILFFLSLLFSLCISLGYGFWNTWLNKLRALKFPCIVNETVALVSTALCRNPG